MKKQDRKAKTPGLIINFIFTYMKEKLETNSKKVQRMVFSMLFLMMGLIACKDDGSVSGYNPSNSIEITRIDPEEGGVGTQCLIYGRNFGTDLSQIEVTVNGKKAPVIGSDGSCIYCSVPVRAGSGPVKVKIGKEDNVQECTAEQEFKYEFVQRVSTLAGYTDKNNNSEIKDGKFEEAGFETPYWLETDKITGDLYLLEERKAIRRIDLKRDTVETIFKITESIGQPRSLSFSTNGDTLFISNDQDAENGISTGIAFRKTSFKKVVGLINSRSCCGSSCHPINPGEYFYNQWGQGNIFKWNFATGEGKELYTMSGTLNGTIQFAPSGKFAYMVDRDHHCVYKAVYDERTHELQKALSFCGKRMDGEGGFADGVGMDAMFSRPGQGCFDENDNFYLCDQGNHCIRKIEPNATVTTFAGRPQNWGYADGTLRKEAQFNRPLGIAYDSSTETFYVADKENRRIRTILKE